MILWIGSLVYLLIYSYTYCTMTDGAPVRIYRAPLSPRQLQLQQQSTPPSSQSLTTTPANTFVESPYTKQSTQWIPGKLSQRGNGSNHIKPTTTQQIVATPNNHYLTDQHSTFDTIYTIIHTISRIVLASGIIIAAMYCVRYYINYKQQQKTIKLNQLEYEKYNQTCLHCVQLDTEYKHINTYIHNRINELQSTHRNDLDVINELESEYNELQQSTRTYTSILSILTLLFDQLKLYLYERTLYKNKIHELTVQIQHLKSIQHNNNINSIHKTQSNRSVSGSPSVPSIDNTPPTPVLNVLPLNHHINNDNVSQMPSAIMESKSPYDFYS